VSQATRISFGFILAALVLTGWLHLGVVLLAILFSYFAISKLDFLKPHGRRTAVGFFVVLLGIAFYGVGFFLQSTVEALPAIAVKAVPAVTQWADAHQIRLPFTDFTSLKEQLLKSAASEANNIGKFANFATGATKEFIYLLVGCVVAMGLYLNPRLELDHEPAGAKNNLYSACCAEITTRFARFYESFCMVMRAQVIISSIDATLTGIFIEIMGLHYLIVAVGITFLCGLLPVVGNLLSNTVVVGLGFIASPTKGLIALAYLVCIHQLEYLLNSKIIGGKIRSPLWLTLLALVLGEALMGIAGMILAPAILHYIRIEMSLMHADSKTK
jgi:predicted PurR-regulated permease PerM